MKKIVVIALGLALVASVCQAQTQVLSRNAVGYVKLTVRSNTLFVARNDFEGLAATLVISNAIGDQLPANSQILIWNKVSQAWRAPITKTAFGWGGGGTNPLPRGEAFFIRLPASVPSNSYDVFFMGEVPDRNQPSGTGTTYNIYPGLNLTADAFPVSRKWTSTVMSVQLPVNSQLLIWNETNQSYNTPITKTAFGWGVGNTLTIEPGVGFWVRSPSAVTFSETKPYTWP